MTPQSRFGGTVNDPVTYSVNVTAQKTSAGWELTLDNGRQVQVTTLDEAATRIRTLLDIYQPAVNHDTVTVTLAISPTAAPAKTAAPSVTPAASPTASTASARPTAASSATSRATSSAPSTPSARPAAASSATSSSTYTPAARPTSRPAESATPTTSARPTTAAPARPTTSAPPASTRSATSQSSYRQSASTPSASSPSSYRPSSSTPQASSPSTYRPSTSNPPASTPPTFAPPTTAYGSVGPSGLECTLWLTAAKERHARFADAAVEVFPWIDTLPAEQRRRCLGDIHVGLKRATDDYAYGELRDTVSRWKKISAAPPVAPTAPHNNVRPAATTATPGQSSFGNYPAAIHRTSAASTSSTASPSPTTSASYRTPSSAASSSPADGFNPQGRHRL